MYHVSLSLFVRLHVPTKADWLDEVPEDVEDEPDEVDDDDEVPKMDATTGLSSFSQPAAASAKATIRHRRESGRDTEVIRKAG